MSPEISSAGWVTALIRSSEKSARLALNSLTLPTSAAKPSGFGAICAYSSCQGEPISISGWMVCIISA